VIPVFNGERYIGEAIDSICKQSFKDIEILVIDDGSSDRSSEIVNNFNDPRISIYSRPHKGLVDSLNFGISVARGKWLARMDADDIAVPDRFSMQLDFFAKPQDVVALGGGAEIIDGSGQSTGRTIFPPEDHIKLINILLRKEKGISLIHPTVMMRKDALLRCGGYRSAFPASEDSDLWLRLSRVGKLQSLMAPLVKLRKHNDNVSVTRNHIQTKSYLGAAISHIVWEQRGVDLVYEVPEIWQRCISEVQNLIDIYRLVDLKTYRRELKTIFKKRQFLKTLFCLNTLLFKLKVVDIFKIYQYEKEIVSLVVEMAKKCLDDLNAVDSCQMCSEKSGTPQSRDKTFSFLAGE
jgi:glycosyltransferase involved in cell wall biosynthesis